MRKAATFFPYPWKLSDSGIQHFTRLTKIQFLEFVYENHGFIKLKCRLNAYAAIFLVLVRLAHEIPWHFLGECFGVNHQTAANIFYSTTAELFLHRSNIPVLVTPNGQVNQGEIDKMLSQAYNNTPVYFRELVKDFKDPSSR